MSASTNQLDELFKNNSPGAACGFIKDPDLSDLLTDKTLNLAVLSGYHPAVTKLLDAGVKPNEDTMTCALFSGLPHFSVTRLLDMGADVTLPKKHVDYSNLHHPVRSRIKGERLTNLAVKSATALQYAKHHLAFLKEKYGPFHGLIDVADREVETEKRKKADEEELMKNGGNQYPSIRR